MKRIESVFIAFYCLLIRLYPRPFREEFGAEMEAIFQEQMADAVAQSRFLLLQICWRELRDWPFHCFQAHWQMRQQRLKTLPEGPPSWWDTAVTGFPYLLFAPFLSGSALFFLFGQTTSLFISLLLGYGFVFVLLLVLIFAWWRGWPIWSVAWLGFLFFILLALILPVQLFNLLGQNPQMQPVRIIVTEVGLPLVWLAVLYVLLARWPRAGLAAMLPAFGMTWLLYLEFVPESVKTAVMAGTWIWLGIIAIVLLRWRHHAWDVWLLYLAAIVVGMIYIYTGHFLTEVPVRDGTFARMGEALLSDLLPALIPAVGILLLHTMRLWSWRNGRMAIASYRLMLAGVLLTVIGVQITLRLLLRQGNLSVGPPDLNIWFTAVLLIGFLLMAASIRHMVKSRPQWQLSGGWPIWLLLGLLLLMPLVFDMRWLPVIYNQIKYQQLSSAQFAQQQIETRIMLIRQMSHLVGVVWLLSAGWMIGRIRPQLPPIPSPKIEDAAATTTVQTTVSHVPGSKGSLTKRKKLYFVAGLLVLVSLLLPITTLAIVFPNDQVQPFDLQTAFPLFLIMTTALMMTAVLLSTGFSLYQARVRNTAVYFFILSVFLATIWLIFTLPNKVKLAAFLYLLLVPPLLIVVSGRAQRVDFHQLTEVRAARVRQAIEVYNAQEGHYPDDLRQLTPSYLFSLSEPMIIFGQDWCYDGGGDDYYFGYVYREHWSDPRLVGRIYSAADEEVPDRPFICEKEIMALEARAPQYYGLRNE